MSLSPDCLVLVLQVPLLKVAILAELVVGTRHPVITPGAMSLSPDCVFVLHLDRLTACIAGGFIERTLALQAKEAELMATLQLVIAVVHPVACLAFLHFCLVWGYRGYRFVTLVFAVMNL